MICLRAILSNLYGGFGRLIEEVRNMLGITKFGKEYNLRELILAKTPILTDSRKLILKSLPFSKSHEFLPAEASSLTVHRHKVVADHHHSQL